MRKNCMCGHYPPAKRFLSLIVAMTIIMSFAPITANAVIASSGFCGSQGDNLTWTFDSNGTLTISGEGAMQNYYSDVRVPWYDNQDNIKTVNIQNSVTSIGDMAFWGCTSLKDVYYFGTEDQWKAIEINSANDRLLNAAIHYNYKYFDTEISTDFTESVGGYVLNSKITNINKAVVYVAAVYDKNDCLLDIETKDIKSGTENVRADMPKNPEAAYIQVFIWDSLTNMQPLSDVYNISI